MPSSSEDESFAEQLTPRESEVLRLLADGLGNKDIAQKLSISEHTIKFHIHSILGKLGVRRELKRSRAVCEAVSSNCEIQGRRPNRRRRPEL